MKLLTLNTHSRPESCESVVETLSAWILSHDIDLIALQEVNQSLCERALTAETVRVTGGYPIPQSEICVKQDNFAYVLAQKLREKQEYRWCCLPFKRGYDCYDEGLALLWRGEAADMDVVPLSETQDAMDWRRRMALGICLGKRRFYCLHTSRYDDDKEPFSAQWQRLRAHLQGRERVYLLGDFNCPADHSGEGYDRMIADGWRDAFTAAALTRGYATVKGRIDGWHDTHSAYPQRIDYIMTNDHASQILRCETVFDGLHGGEMLSDHCGIFCHIKEDGANDGRKT